MLQLPWLRAMATAARPSFLTLGDCAMTGAEAASTSSNEDGCVCWASSQGCLTPLHYDLADGLLAQVLATSQPPTYIASKHSRTGDWREACLAV